MGARRGDHGGPALHRVHAFGRLRGWRPTGQIGAYAAGLAAIGLALAAIHGASDPFAGTLAAGAIVGEVTAFSGERKGPPPTGPRKGAVARRVGLAAIALGGVAYLLGQTGSPLCRPESLFQWHALWHVLVAVFTRGLRVRDLRPAEGPCRERLTPRPEARQLDP